MHKCKWKGAETHINGWTHLSPDGHIYVPVDHLPPIHRPVLRRSCERRRRVVWTEWDEECQSEIMVLYLSFLAIGHNHQGEGRMEGREGGECYLYLCLCMSCLVYAAAWCWCDVICDEQICIKRIGGLVIMAWHWESVKLLPVLRHRVRR